MKNWNYKPLMLAVAAFVGSLNLAGCAQGGGDGAVAVNGGLDDNSNVIFPNDGSTGSSSNGVATITEGGTSTSPGPGLTGHFICDAGVSAFASNAATAVATGGIVGSPAAVTGLLNGLGGTTVTALLNSVKDKDAVIDNKLATFATFSLSVDLLSVLSSVDELVFLNHQVPAGNYAVFGVRFPAATLELSLLNSVTVTTFLNGVAQESVGVSETSLDLLGTTVVGDTRLFIGVKTTKPYDTAAISLRPSVLSADVGAALYVHELCTKGHFIP